MTILRDNNYWRSATLFVWINFVCNSTPISGEILNQPLRPGSDFSLVRQGEFVGDVLPTDQINHSDVPLRHSLPQDQVLLTSQLINRGLYQNGSSLVVESLLRRRKRGAGHRLRYPSALAHTSRDHLLEDSIKTSAGGIKSILHLSNDLMTRDTRDFTSHRRKRHVTRRRRHDDRHVVHDVSQQTSHRRDDADLEVGGPREDYHGTGIGRGGGIGEGESLAEEQDQRQDEQLAQLLQQLKTQQQLEHRSEARMERRMTLRGNSYKVKGKPELLSCVIGCLHQTHNGLPRQNPSADQFDYLYSADQSQKGVSFRSDQLKEDNKEGEGNRLDTCLLAFCQSRPQQQRQQQTQQQEQKQQEQDQEQQQQEQQQEDEKEQQRQEQRLSLLLQQQQKQQKHQQRHQRKEQLRRQRQLRQNLNTFEDKDDNDYDRQERGEYEDDDDLMSLDVITSQDGVDIKSQDDVMRVDRRFADNTDVCVTTHCSGLAPTSRQYLSCLSDNGCNGR